VTARTSPTFRHRLEFFGLSSGAFLVRQLPFGWLRRLAWILGTIVYSLDRRGREVGVANLEAAFPGKLSEKRKAWVVRASYQGFARTMLELIWAPNLTREVFQKYGKVEGLVPPEEVEGQPTIYLCLHASNFEWLSLALSYAMGPGIVVTQNFKNPLLGQMFDRFRSSTGHTIIPQERAMMRMLRHLKAGGYFNLVVDLNLDPREASVIVDQFDGLKTCVTQMHAALALHTKARIVPAECHPQPDGTYRLVYHKPIVFSSDTKPEEIAQRCWDVLEPYVTNNPEYWLWSYKHWRFKPNDAADTRYPFYANTATRFDKKLQKQETEAAERAAAFKPATT